MTTPEPASLQGAESDLHTAQSESDPRRQGQYARSAADTAAEVAAEVAVDNATSSADRERAVAVVQEALGLATGSLLREAQSTLSIARGTTDPQRRRDLARSAVSKARQHATATSPMTSGRQLAKSLVTATCSPRQSVPRSSDSSASSANSRASRSDLSFTTPEVAGMPTQGFAP